MQKNNNHEINLPGIINIWVTLEATIEDVCVSLILEGPAALDRLRKVNKKVSDTPVTSEESARKVYERSLQQLKKQGLVGALLDLLTQLGLRISIADETKDHLNELNYVRNCALHRNGVVEQRKNIEAPTLPVSIGSRLNISDELFLRYYDAVGKLLCELHAKFDSP